MKYAQALACVAGFFQLAHSLPSAAEPRQATCTSPRLRKSWDAATTAEKTAYLNAAVCLTKKPSRLGTAGSTLHDDFTIVHFDLNEKIHSVAAFMPWHRFFVQVYEDALRTECGYQGTALYWDWVADSADPASASVWDSNTGFGGNGTSPDGSWGSFCVRDGPFKDWRPRWNSGIDEPHCLQRNWLRGQVGSDEQDLWGYAYDAGRVAQVFEETRFQEFAYYLENGPHSAVHQGVGGFVGDLSPLTSPNDPIFFLHHTMVDRLWWQWQQEDPARVFDFVGDIYPDETLADTLRMGGLAPDRTVQEFMDASNDELCYRY